MYVKYVALFFTNVFNINMHLSKHTRSPFNLNREKTTKKFFFSGFKSCDSNFPLRDGGDGWGVGVSYQVLKFRIGAIRIHWRLT